MSQRIEVGIEKVNHGHWLRVSVPYTTQIDMMATVHSHSGEMLRSVKLMSGHNLIDIQSITDLSVRIKIDTPYETLSRELILE